MLTLSQLGKKIKKFREEIGFSQEFVAKQLGVSRQAIINIEAGKRKVDSFELFKLADLFNINAGDLLVKAEIPPASNFKEAVVHLRNNNLLDDDEKKALLEFKKICEDYEFLKNLFKNEHTIKLSRLSGDEFALLCEAKMTQTDFESFVYATDDHQRTLFLNCNNDLYHILVNGFFRYSVLQIITAQGDQDNPGRTVQDICFQPGQSHGRCISRNASIDDRL